jgi:hypothetical protein
MVEEVEVDGEDEDGEEAGEGIIIIMVVERRWGGALRQQQQWRTI